MKVKLTARECTTLIEALRYYQGSDTHRGEEEENNQILDDNEIDELCERINFA